MRVVVKHGSTTVIVNVDVANCPGKSVICPLRVTV